MSDDTTARRFDPAKYLRKLKGADYLEVKWRLVWLRTEHPDAVIETELHQLDLDRAIAVYRARVAIPGAGTATGWGMEERKDFNDYLEKAETKALGRALAALGFGTQFADDFDFERPDGSKVVDAPVQRGAGRDFGARVQEPVNTPSAPRDADAPRPTGPGRHLVDEARRLGGTPVPPDAPAQRAPGGGKSVSMIGDVAAVTATINGKQVYQTVARCEAHDGPWYARLTETGQITIWSHKVRGTDKFCYLN